MMRGSTSPGLLALQEKRGMPIALSGIIAGGGMRDDGPGRLGVFFDHDPKEFRISGSQQYQIAELKAQGGTQGMYST
jgi:hypothetical protein